MIIVPIKEGENIERALKRYKRKYNDTGIVRTLRKRQAFQKPSDVNRRSKGQAEIVQKKYSHQTNITHKEQLDKYDNCTNQRGREHRACAQAL